MALSDPLVYLAGETALPLVRDEGLSPDRIDIIPGAAGGPKWLILKGMDQALFGGWLKGRTRPLFLVGSSAGAWRFAAACRQDPLAALDRFEEAYIAQTYTRRPSPAEVAAECRRILAAILAGDGAGEITAHPFLRLSAMAVRSRWPAVGRGQALEMAGLFGAALANTIRRRWLGYFYERALFHDPRQEPPLFARHDFPLRRIPLSRENLSPALLASGAIPLVIPPMEGIPGAPAGKYWDGGVIDYHLNLPFDCPADRLVFFPHFIPRVIPGWLDKNLPWRKADPSFMKATLLVAPSPAFVQSLPHGRIPDRQDFFRFQGRDRERIACWRGVVRQSVQLADAFMEDVASGRIRHKVKPLTPLS